jgi:hypothetical protein
MKDYLGCENARNKRHAALYTAIMHEAFGSDAAVLIGHHLTFEIGGNIETENEIPSADTMMFDHYVMGKVFGADAVRIMQRLASVSVELRDDVLQREWDARNIARVVPCAAARTVSASSMLADAPFIG